MIENKDSLLNVHKLLELIYFKQVDNSSLDSETRKRIEKGWLNNAYNE